MITELRSNGQHFRDGHLLQFLPEMVEMAVQCAGSSAPGRDGIPYEAYKGVKFAAYILTKVLKHMFDNGDVIGNLDFFCFSSMKSCILIPQFP